MAENDNIISGINLSRKFINPKSRNSRVIKKEELAGPVKNIVQTVGGDSDDVKSTPPTIIIERNGEHISKIIVKCPCGRHSELLCEYHDDAEPEPDQP
ncbi:MAG: hypothetical protein PHQ27_11400 [Victivallales bacterium]|nr:hypothetical protein [Victivallales bacterium]